jgi:hypothetical protein
VPAARIVLLLVLAAPALAGDLMLRERTSGGAEPGASEEAHQWLGAEWVVVDDPHQRSIVDLGGHTVTVVDKEKHTYTVSTFDELRHRAALAGEALRNLPPDARRMMGLDTPVTLTATGQSEQIAGHQAKEYRVGGGGVTGTVWVTDELHLPAGARTWEELTAELAGHDRAGGTLPAEIARLGGVPLRRSLTVSIGSEKVRTTSEVVEVKETGPPTDLLVVPGGYARVDPPSEE